MVRSVRVRFKKQKNKVDIFQFSLSKIYLPPPLKKDIKKSGVREGGGIPSLPHIINTFKNDTKLIIYVHWSKKFWDYYFFTGVSAKKFGKYRIYRIIRYKKIITILLIQIKVGKKINKIRMILIEKTGEMKSFKYFLKPHMGVWSFRKRRDVPVRRSSTSSTYSGLQTVRCSSIPRYCLNYLVLSVCVTKSTVCLGSSN